ncbi:hypothetical protein BDZ89DRAFT_1037481 [Hymenopellis radicata]|nr:hypothetical protein BDZ89DRAFT_1037481 [Hymenopellis radicata]
MFRRLFSAIELPQADRRLSKLPDPPDESKRAQASAIDRITPQNEQFIRTYHPAFEMAPDVFVRKITLEDSVWAVHPSHIRDCSYYRERNDVAGRVVHGAGASSTSKLKAEGSINTRKILSEGEIMAIREQFPEAIGLRVFVAGYLTVLFKSVADLKNVAYRPWPSELGNLKVQLEVWNDRPCTDGGNAMQFGLRLVGTFEIGEESREMEVITVATNDFVTTPELSSTVASYDSSGECEGRSPMEHEDGAGYAAVGKEVTSPDGSPRSELSSNHTMKYRCFFHFRMDINTTCRSLLGTGWRTLTSQPDRRVSLGSRLSKTRSRTEQPFSQVQHIPGAETIVRKSLVEGQQYTWDSSVVARSLLWRTRDDAVFDMRGSATMLCLGGGGDGDVVRLVAFQSFQAMLPTSGVRERTGTVFFERLGEAEGEGAGGDGGSIWYRGGFEVPAEVMKADIVKS